MNHDIISRIYHIYMIIYIYVCIYIYICMYVYIYIMYMYTLIIFVGHAGFQKEFWVRMIKLGNSWVLRPIALGKKRSVGMCKMNSLGLRYVPL